MISSLLKVGAALLIMVCAIILALTASRSPAEILQLLLSLILAIGCALVGVRGMIEFLSERYQ